MTRQPKTQRFELRLTPEDKKRLSELSNLYQVSESEWLRMMIRDFHSAIGDNYIEFEMPHEEE